MPKTVWDTSKLISLSDKDNLAEALLQANGLSKSEISQFLSPSYPANLCDPLSLPGIKPAVKKILAAIKSKSQIVIYGDYDIDGLTATALLNDFFGSIGANVATFIPDRFEQGYGLHANSLIDLQKAGAELVITVDCGTTATNALKTAKKIGLDVIVTDHHTPPEKLPTGAIAIVNPKLSHNSRVFTELAGVGVAFNLVRALMISKPDIIEDGREKWLLDLVALGTVCDVVPLQKDNRVLTYFGLKVLQKTRRKGIRALAQVAGVDISNINESDLGFRLGPRLNAAGRLEHAQKALELLITDDSDRALELAMDLNVLNSDRQAMTQTIYDEANSMAKKYKSDPILVLSSPDWSHGVVGIVASRISEKHHKPVILLQELEDNTKGSARSFGEFNIVEAIRACSEMLDAFGGHAFAAGMTLQTDRIEEFRYRLNQYALSNMAVENNFKKLRIHGDYDNTIPKLDVIDQLNNLSPFGSANTEPLFMGNYKVSSMRFVGQQNNHLKLSLQNSSGNTVNAIAFSAVDKWPWLNEGEFAQFAFRLQKNVWQDNISLQYEVVDVRQPKTNT